MLYRKLAAMCSLIYV